MHKKEQPKSPIALVILILLVVVGIAAVMVWSFLPQETPAEPVRPTAAPAAPTAAPTAAAPLPSATVPTDNGDLPAETEAQTAVALGHGLEITDVGRYTGMYMEDGSNEVVSDVMMIVVQNNGDQDIQLAEITAVFGGVEFRFTLTNLAVGERAVLLDQDRRASVRGELESVTLGSTALFQEPMELQEDVIEIGGLEGMLNVKNISDADIDGDICVYYKYAAQDIYYGGITFRIRIEGGLKAGEIRQIPAGHFDPKGCDIVQVTIYE